MQETNSEKKLSVWAIVGVIATVLGAAADSLLGTGVLEQWPTAVTIVSGIVGVTAIVIKYTDSRPKKHLALAERNRSETPVASAEK